MAAPRRKGETPTETGLLIKTAPSIARAEDRSAESCDDPVRGRLSWFTLFDSAITPTAGLTAGIAELRPDDGGQPHRHAQPEIYFILEGQGLLTIDGAERSVSPGDAIFIPGGSRHSLRNAADAVLRLLYVFPADGMADVVYDYA